MNEHNAFLNHAAQCPVCGVAQEHEKVLVEQNAKLREQVDKVKDEYVDAYIENAKLQADREQDSAFIESLQADNAKLRGVVAHYRSLIERLRDSLRRQIEASGSCSGACCRVAREVLAESEGLSDGTEPSADALGGQ